MMAAKRDAIRVLVLVGAAAVVAVAAWPACALELLAAACGFWLLAVQVAIGVDEGEAGKSTGRPPRTVRNTGAGQPDAVGGATARELRGTRASARIMPRPASEVNRRR